MPPAEPRRPTAPDAGPWGTERDLEAIRKAVGRAEGRGFGDLVTGLVLLAFVGLVGSLVWLGATHWLTTSNPLRGGGPRLIPKAALKPIAKPAPTVVATPTAGTIEAKP
jgi:hypothetical protein